MDAVGNNLNSHVVNQIYALHSTFVLVFATFVETGHRIVEMGGVAIAVFPCRQNVLKLSLGVGNRSKYALAAYIFAELHGAR